MRSNFEKFKLEEYQLVIAMFEFIKNHLPGYNMRSSLSVDDIIQMPEGYTDSQDGWVDIFFHDMNKGLKYFGEGGKFNEYKWIKDRLGHQKEGVDMLIGVINISKKMEVVITHKDLFLGDLTAEVDYRLPDDLLDEYDSEFSLQKREEFNFFYEKDKTEETIQKRVKLIKKWTSFLTNFEA